MSAHDPDTIDAIAELNQGYDFGRYAREQELLPLLKGASRTMWALIDALGDAHRIHADMAAELGRVIADIEKPPTPPTSTLPTDDESIPF